MSRRAFKAVHESFADEVARAFGFLVSDFGLAGPKFRTTVLPVVSFAGHGRRYRVSLDPLEMAVTTSIELDEGSTRFTAKLEDLVQSAGLDARNKVSHSAHSVTGLQKTLDAQAEYVRLLQPKLSPGMALELMREAGATERTNVQSRHD